MWLPRMTTRRWMIAVALIALALGGREMLRRRSLYRAEAASNVPVAHVYGEGRYMRIKSGEYIFRKELYGDDGRMKEEVSRHFDTLHEHFAGLVRKYRYAADHPWLPVPPDPPQPRWDKHAGGR